LCAVYAFVLLHHVEVIIGIVVVVIIPKHLLYAFVLLHHVEVIIGILVVVIIAKHLLLDLPSIATKRKKTAGRRRATTAEESLLLFLRLYHEKGVRPIR
jgi:hypothetical protein